MEDKIKKLLDSSKDKNPSLDDIFKPPQSVFATQNQNMDPILDLDALEKFIEMNSESNLDKIMKDVVSPNLASKSNSKQKVETFEDLALPFNNILKLMKASTPKGNKIGKETVITMQECATELINFIVSEASERAQKDQRKTLMLEDVIQAVRSLGFYGYEPFLQGFSNFIETKKSEK